MPDWKFLKRFGRPDRAASFGGSSLEAHADEFELSEDEAGFKTASTPAPQNWTSSIKRLGSTLSRTSTAAASSIVEFDASDHESDDQTPYFSTPPSPATSTTSLHKNGLSPAGSRPQSRQAQVNSPSRSALTFLTKVSEIGIHAAIQQEVAAIQTEKIDAFARNLADRGIDAAIRSAELDITDHHRTGQAKQIDPTDVIDKFRENVANNGPLTAEKSAFEQIQRHHHRGIKDGHLNTVEIATNFQKNGSGIQAAELALAYIEASQSHIQVNELSGAARESKNAPAEHRAEDLSASKTQRSRPSAGELYGERNRDLCR